MSDIGTLSSGLPHHSPQWPRYGRNLSIISWMKELGKYTSRKLFNPWNGNICCDFSDETGGSILSVASQAQNDMVFPVAVEFRNTHS